MMSDDSQLLIEEEDSIDVQYYLQLLYTVLHKYYRWLILLAVVSVGATWFKMQAAVPTYTASTTIHLAPSDRGMFSYNQYYWSSSDSSFQNTQIGIIRSKHLMERVATKLGLHELVAGAADDGRSERQRIEQAASSLLGAVSVAPASRNEFSSLIQISVTWLEPEMAARIANTVADSYIEVLFEKEVDQTVKSQEFLSSRLVGLRDELRTAEERLQDFLEQQDIVKTGYGENAVDDELATVTTQVLEARQKRLQLESLYQQVRNLDTGSQGILNVPAIADHPQMQRISERIYDINRRQLELGQRYGPKHKKMIALAAESDAATQALAEQAKTVIATIRSDVEFARTNEQLMESTLSEVRERKQSVDRKDYELRDLQQDVETKREIYTAFTERLNQNDAAGPVRNDNIWVVDPAAVPRGANLPPVERYMMMALALSLMGGIGLGVLVELNRNTLANQDEVEKNLGVACVGVLPLLESEDNLDEVNSARLLEVYVKEPHAFLSEAIRSLRTSLLLQAPGQECRRFLVTSSEAGEGKSSVILSLAASFAQMKSVLLIDCDLRKPSLDRALNKTEHRNLGLSDVLASAAEVRDCVRHDYESGVNLLPAGSRSLNPLEMLSSSQFTRLLDQLSQEYEIILIDSPPCLAVSDTYVLASHADSVIFVVKAAATRVPAVRSVLAKLKALDVRVAGVLLNQLDFNSPYHKGHYGDYYQRHYAEEASEHDDELPRIVASNTKSAG